MDDVITILIVEDDQLIQVMIEEAFSDGGFVSAVTESGEEAIALLQANKFEYRAVVTDINLLGKRNGWEVAQRAREWIRRCPVIYMTGTNRRAMGIEGRAE